MLNMLNNGAVWALQLQTTLTNSFAVQRWIFLLKCEPKNVLTLTHPQALCVCVCLNVLIHSDLICCHRHRRSCADSANHHSFPFSSFPSHHSSNCIFFSVFAPLHTHTRKLHFPRHVVININSWCRVSHESFM